MSSDVYYAVVVCLGLGVLGALLVACVSLIAVAVRWRTPTRRGHAKRLIGSLIAVPCLVGLATAVVWLLFWPALRREQSDARSGVRAQEVAAMSLVRVGELVPEFSVTDADGRDFTMAGARGKVVLINFFATWCGPCQVELPHIERIWDRLRANDRFELLVIGREESMDAVRDYRTKHGFTFPIAPDPTKSIYGLFATALIPRTFVVSADGVIVYSQGGFLESDLAELETVLAAQLK